MTVAASQRGKSQLRSILFVVSLIFETIQGIQDFTTLASIARMYV